MIKLDNTKRYLFFKNDVINTTSWVNSNGEEKQAVILKIPFKKDKDDNTLYTITVSQKLVTPLKVENGKLIKSNDDYYSFVGATFFKPEKGITDFELSYLKDEKFQKLKITYADLWSCLNDHKAKVLDYVGR